METNPNHQFLATGSIPFHCKEQLELKPSAVTHLTDQITK